MHTNQNEGGRVASNQATAEAKHYLSVGELSEFLGRTADKVRYWVSRDIFPAPDAVFGGPERGTINLWDRDRIVALIVDDGKGTEPALQDAGDYTWDVTPEYYITSYGVAALLHLSPNTVKWWLLDEGQRRAKADKKRRTDRVGKTKDPITLPPCDATSAWASGWKAETIWNWWNNDHPRLVGEGHNRQRSAIYTDLLASHQVALIDYSTDEPLQIRAAIDSDSIDHVAAATVLADAAEPAHALAGNADGCWFIPDLSTLAADDQQTVVEHLASLDRPAIALYTDPATLPTAESPVAIVDAPALAALFRGE